MKKEFLLTCAAIAAITAGASVPATQVDNNVAAETGIDASDIALAPTYNSDSTKYAMYVIQNAVYGYIAPNGYSYGNNYHLAFVPAYTDITFVNKSTASPTTWTYTLDGKNYQSSTDKNLVLSFEPLTEYKLPHLEIDADNYYTPVNDSRLPSENLSKLHVGGTALDTDWKPGATRVTNADSTMYMFGADLTQCTLSSTKAAYISYFTGVKVNTADTTISATSTMKTVLGSDVTKVARIGVAQRFPAMGADYLIKDVCFKLSLPNPATAKEGAVVSGKIYTFDGTTASAINSSLTVIGEFAYTLTSALAPESGKASAITSLSTPVRYKDSKVANGIVVPGDKQILVAIDGFEGIDYVCPQYFFYPIANKSFYTNNVYFKYAADNGKTCYVPCTNYSTTNGYPYNTYIGINVEFDYLHFDETTVTLSADGSEVVVSDCNTYHKASEWTITEDTNGTGVVAGWLKYKISEGTDAHSPVITFSADKATAARETTFTINGPSAASAVLTVKQAEQGTGVDAVVTDAVKVSKVGENFQVAVSEDVTAVAVYNLNGQLVATQALYTGVNTVDASTLASGVYVLKFNNGVTVKAVK